MKKLIALMMMVSFITVSSADAFAAQRPISRGRVSGRVEHRNTNRGSDLRSQLQRSHRDSINRSTPLHRRTTSDRLSRPRDYFNRTRPITRPHDRFFDRSRMFDRRSFSYRGRPYYGYGNYHRSNSMSPLEFLGIGAAIIAIAAAASHAHCDY
jgi:hypothetical protein